MALSKVNFNSLNLTPTASKTVVFNSNNNGIEAGDVGGSMVLISEQTASSSATISFTSNIDSTYPIYKFVWINCHPATSNAQFSFNMSTDSGSNYNIAKTSTFIQADHSEAGSGGLNYDSDDDLAQGTGFQYISDAIGNDNDSNANGSLLLFNPSSTTFVKHFISRGNGMYNGNYQSDCLAAGYGNTTSAVDAIQFKMSSGNIDSGTIKMYGVT